jgi:hypothetical protein
MVNAWKSHDSVVSLLDKNDARVQLHLSTLDKQFGYVVVIFIPLIFTFFFLFFSTLIYLFFPPLRSRMQLRIAVIFVGKGQEREPDILANTMGSSDYEDFLVSLGWEVDLTTHSGYRGGLEKTLKSGSKTQYFCSPTYEVIFHVATKMPTDLSDPTQLKKVSFWLCRSTSQKKKIIIFSS